MKKLLSLALAVLMVCALFAGCAKTPASSAAPTPSQTDSKPETSSEAVKKLDPYEVKWILRITPQDETATTNVLKNINEKVLPKLIDNTTLNIEWIQASEYVEKMKLKFSGKEEFDNCLSMVSLGFADFVQQKAFLDLNDYWDYLPETRKVIPESWWDATSVDGACYGIPNYQITARNYSVAIPNEAIKAMKLDLTTVKTLDDVEKVLDFMVKDEKWKNTTIDGGGANLFYNEGYIYSGIEQVTDMIGVPLSDPTKVVNIFEFDGYVKQMKRLREWNQKGYIQPDVAKMGDDITLAKSGKISMRFECWQPGYEVTLKDKYGIDGTYVTLGDPMVTTNTVRSTMTSVSFTSKNPERACMMIDLMNSKPELFNALAYGIEGTNYTLDNGQAVPVNDSGYAVCSWSYQMGNTLIGYQLKGKPTDFAEQVDKMNRKGKASSILGFSFNAESVQTELSACKAIYKNYVGGFQDGEYADVEATIKAMNDELYAAGLQKIIDECQKQLDAWYAAKK